MERFFERAKARAQRELEKFEEQNTKNIYGEEILLTELFIDLINEKLARYRYDKPMTKVKGDDF